MLHTQQISEVRFDVLKVVSSKVMVFWDVMSCNLIDRYQCFGGIWSFYQVPPKLWYLSNNIPEGSYLQMAVTLRYREELQQERNLRSIIYAFKTNSFLQ
jgi:hypothetical protein